MIALALALPFRRGVGVLSNVTNVFVADVVSEGGEVVGVQCIDTAVKTLQSLSSGFETEAYDFYNDVLSEGGSFLSLQCVSNAVSTLKLIEV